MMKKIINLTQTIFFYNPNFSLIIFIIKKFAMNEKKRKKEKEMHNKVIMKENQRVRDTHK